MGTTSLIYTTNTKYYALSLLTNQYQSRDSLLIKCLQKKPGITVTKKDSYVCCMFELNNLDDVAYNIHIEKKQDAR